MATVNEPTKPAQLSGTWVSPPCGARTWTRTVVIEAEGGYHGSDPVSPCPPGVNCIWSGIIEFRGTWVMDGARVVLTESPDRRPPMAAAYQRPADLTMKDGSLYDPEGCKYDKTVP